MQREVKGKAQSFPAVSINTTLPNEFHRIGHALESLRGIEERAFRDPTIPPRNVHVLSSHLRLALDGLLSSYRHFTTGRPSSGCYHSGSARNHLSLLGDTGSGRNEKEMLALGALHEAAKILLKVTELMPGVKGEGGNLAKVGKELNKAAIKILEISTALGV